MKCLFGWMGMIALVCAMVVGALWKGHHKGYADGYAACAGDATRVMKFDKEGRYYRVDVPASAQHQWDAFYREQARPTVPPLPAHVGVDSDWQPQSDDFTYWEDMSERPVFWSWIAGTRMHQARLPKVQEAIWQANVGRCDECWEYGCSRHYGTTQ